MASRRIRRRQGVATDSATRRSLPLLPYDILDDGRLAPRIRDITRAIDYARSGDGAEPHISARLQPFLRRRGVKKRPLLAKPLSSALKAARLGFSVAKAPSKGQRLGFVCGLRMQRKEVLHAYRIAGKKGLSGAPGKSRSKISCKGKS